MAIKRRPNEGRTKRRPQCFQYRLFKDNSPACGRCKLRDECKGRTTSREKAVEKAVGDGKTVRKAHRYVELVSPASPALRGMSLRRLRRGLRRLRRGLRRRLLRELRGLRPVVVRLPGCGR
jgi:hypothetical protein